MQGQVSDFTELPEKISACVLCISPTNAADDEK